jgi:tetratricopeptide (TPR) repeat protein
VLAVSFTTTGAQAQLAVRQSNLKILFLIPHAAETADSAFAVQLANEVRTRLRNKMRHKLLIIQSDVICQVLEESAYSCDAVLGPADADRLARALVSDAYITGSLWRDGDAPVARFHIINVSRSGLSGWTTVTGLTEDQPRDFAETIVDSLDNQVRAAEHARECSDRIGRGDFSGARNRAERAFRLYPNHPSAAMCAEVVAEAMRQPPDSQIAMLERAVAGDSLLVRGWERLGRLYQQRGDTLSALQAFARQSTIDQGNRELRMGVVAGAITAREYAVARDLANEWLNRNPTDLGMLQLKARTCVEGALWGCAVAALSSQYEVDTTLVGDTVFYQQIIGAAQAMGDTAAQLEWSGIAVDEAPDVVTLWRAHASALATIGNTDSVVAVYERLLSLDPTDFRSALAGARILLEDLPIDTATPLDTARLRKGGSFLMRATTASRDTSVLMNAAVMYYQKGSALVRARKELATAVQWLERSVENDVLGRLSQQSNFFLGLGLMFRIFEFDPQVTETKSCDLVEVEASMVSRGIQAMRLGSSIAPDRAEQFLQQFQAFESRIPNLRRAFQCR